jgi:hypothetical protein
VMLTPSQVTHAGPEAVALNFTSVLPENDVSDRYGSTAVKRGGE